MILLIRCCRAAVLALLLCGLWTMAALADSDTATFTLRPAHSDPARPETKGYFILDGTPGSTLEDTVVVRNSGAIPGTVRLFPVDAATGQNGGSAFPSETAPRRDVGAWIRMSREELTLQPGEEQTVAFTVTIPGDAAAGQHLGGLVALDTAIKEGNQGSTFQVSVQTRMVTAVQVNLPGAAVEQLTVNGVSAGGPQGAQTLTLDLRNEGNVMLKPVGTFTVTDRNGTKLQELPLAIDTFLPRTAIRYPVAVQRQALGPGQYHAAVVLRYGTSGVTNYEGDFSITPAQVAQVFPSAAPLAPPPGTTSVPIAPAVAASRTPWPLIVGGALLIAVLVGVFSLGRRGRRAEMTK